MIPREKFNTQNQYVFLNCNTCQESKAGKCFGEGPVPFYHCSSADCQFYDQYECFKCAKLKDDKTGRAPGSNEEAMEVLKVEEEMRRGHEYIQAAREYLEKNQVPPEKLNNDL